MRRLAGPTKNFDSMTKLCNDLTQSIMKNADHYVPRSGVVMMTKHYGRVLTETVAVNGTERLPSRKGNSSVPGMNGEHKHLWTTRIHLRSSGRNK